MFAFRNLLAAAAVASGAFVAAAPATLAQEVTLKLGHLTNEENIWHKSVLKFADDVKTLTEGRVAVEVYPNETLGRDMDLINGMQLGTVDMMIVGESVVNWAPMAALLAIPYGYPTLESMDAVASGELGKKVEAEMIEKAGIRPIAYFARGPRNLTSNRPITTPDDLNGIKLRVPNVPLFLDTWKALGATPTPMAFGEVFTALQNGTIEAQENPLALIKAANFNEVQSHVNLTEHVRSWIYLAISEMAWEKLSEADQAAVLEAGARTQAYERELFLADEAALMGELEAKGMTFVEVDRAAFAAKARDAVLAGVAPEIRADVQALFDAQDN